MCAIGGNGDLAEKAGKHCLCSNADLAFVDGQMADHMPLLAQKEGGGGKTVAGIVAGEFVRRALGERRIEEIMNLCGKPAAVFDVM